MACRPSTALCQILRPAGFSFPASCVCFQYRWSPNCGIYPPFDDPPQSGYHGEKAPQGQEPPAPPREGDTSDGASAVFGDAEAEDTRGYQGNSESYSNNSIPINSPEDIANNPKALYGKSKEEIANLLDEGWTEGAYGSKKQGWKFTKGDKSIFYHPGGGRHGGAYYGYSSAETGKIKIVGKDYIPIPGDKATIIYFE